MSFSRRRFLVVAAAAAGLALASTRRETWRWRGSALGAEAEIRLSGPREAVEAALAAAAAEIGRLERIFSLNRAESQLSALNRSGYLEAPARDLVAVLGASAHWRRKTEGAFDIAVQPLWLEAAAGPAGSNGLERVRRARIDVLPGRIALAPGTALTLNGIAQGTIADRVTALLSARGFEAPLIDTGEMRLPGAARRRVVLPEAGLALRLAECAVATSAPGALRFGPGRHHLFNPRDGRSPGLWRSVSVIAPEAETADALSTAFAVSEPERIGDLVPQGVGVIATDSAGRVRHFGRMPALAEA